MRRAALPALAAVCAAVCAALCVPAAAQEAPIPPAAEALPDRILRDGIGHDGSRGSGPVMRGQYVVVSGAGAGLQGACLVCHGTDGAGDAAAGVPRLAGQLDWYLHKQLDDYARGTRPDPVMGPIARALTAQERADVALYYAIQKAPPLPQPAADPGGDTEPARGETLARQGEPRAGVQACAACHGAAGEGVPPGLPALAGQPAGYLEEQLLRWRAGIRRNGPVGVMAHIARHLPPEDLRAVSRYYASLPPARADAAPGP